MPPRARAKRTARKAAVASPDMEESCMSPAGGEIPEVGRNLQHATEAQTYIVQFCTVNITIDRAVHFDISVRLNKFRNMANNRFTSARDFLIVHSYSHQHLRKQTHTPRRSQHADYQPRDKHPTVVLSHRRRAASQHHKTLLCIVVNWAAWSFLSRHGDLCCLIRVEHEC
jgi:hypothetical protein